MAMTSFMESIYIIFGLPFFLLPDFNLLKTGNDGRHFVILKNSIIFILFITKDYIVSVENLEKYAEIYDKYTDPIIKH